jgi:hypothetical protein
VRDDALFRREFLADSLTRRQCTLFDAVVQTAAAPVR